MKLFRRRPRLIGAGLLIVATIAALAVVPAARLALVNAPSLWFDGRILTGLAYDATTGLHLDLYLPAGPGAGGARPVIVFFHGGRWQEGERSDYRFVGTALAARGFVVAIPDYRKYPDVRFPAFVEDGAAAVAWVARQIAAHGGDPARILLAGHSAGAHTAALLASDERYLAARGVTGVGIRGVVGLAGPYHFTPRASDLVEIFGPPVRYPQMQVSRFVDGGEPAMLLLYGSDDRAVRPVNLEHMARALETHGVCHRVVTYPGIDHVGLIAALTWVYRPWRPVLDDIIGFLDQAAADRACPA